MIMNKFYRGSVHFLFFVGGLRLLSEAVPRKGDTALLAVAAIVCIALLFQWRRTPGKFGHDPELAAQLLVHGVAIIVAALVARGLTSIAPAWIGVAAIAVVAGLASVASALGRFRQKDESPYRYGGIALASVSLMGLIAASVLWFGQRAV